MARARGQAPGSGGRRRPPRRGSPGTGPRGESAGLLLLLLQVLPPGAAAGPGRRGIRGPGGGCVCWPGAGPAFPRDARLLLLLPPRPPPSPPPSSTAAASPSRMVISAPRGRRGRAGGDRGGGKGGQLEGRSSPPPSDDRGSGQPPERASGAPPCGAGAGSALSLLTGSQAAGESLHLPAPLPGRGGDSVGAQGPALTERAPERRACTEAPGLRVALRSWRLPVPSGRAELRRPQPRREAILGSGGRPRTAGPYVPRTGRSAPRWAPPERGAAAALQPGLGALLDAERGHPGLQHRGAEVRAPPDLALWLYRFLSPSSSVP